MARKRRKVRSVPQRRLMGYAYACATGRAEDCPPSVMGVARSFGRRGRKGLASLRRMASTKHAGLSPTRVSESRILKFNEFRMHESADAGSDFDYLKWISDLGDYDIIEYANEFVSTGDLGEQIEYIDLIRERIDTLRRAGRAIDAAGVERVLGQMRQIVADRVNKNKSTK